MKVRATKLGYYNHERRRAGDVFDISDEKNDNGKTRAFSSRWMEPANGISSLNEKAPKRLEQPRGGKPSNDSEVI